MAERTTNGGSTPTSSAEATAGDKPLTTGQSEFEHATHLDADDVDMQLAATLRPTRARGKGLTMLVTFVAGTGFTLFGYGEALSSTAPHD